MIGVIKQQLRQRLTRRFDRQYRERLAGESLSYDRWIRQREAKEDAGASEGLPKGRIVSACAPREWRQGEEEILFLLDEGAFLREGAKEAVLRAFRDNPRIQVVYGDEDEFNSAKTARMNPWYKPDYSPETLLSYYYFGSLVAFRRRLLEGAALPEEAGAPARQKQYALILQICMGLAPGEVCHLKRMLTTSPAVVYWGFEEEYEAIRGRAAGLLPQREIRGVSVIIPSKDNPATLTHLLASIKKYDGSDDGSGDGGKDRKKLVYELIVVDNGSNAENRRRLEGLREEYGFSYLYEPMDFNFSRMCNKGAQAASLDALLFLNDDCEVCHKGWLEAMAGPASRLGVGAVGAKLLYPDSAKIQHCGVYGIYPGPVHKLQFKDDGCIYGDRRNRDVRNVMAVTAACLMVRKEVFHEAGGFDEAFRVAFNDVDFCWRLYHKGYRNVVNNEVALRHHESLSRGSDDSAEKQKRHRNETDRLYERHKSLWNQDPYYSYGFTGKILDTNYSFAYEYAEEAEILTPRPVKALPKKLREDECVAVFAEHAGTWADWLRFAGRGQEAAGQGELYLQGGALVLGSDNACFERRILLLGEKKGNLYELNPRRLYRPDVVVNVPDQENVALSGFACRVRVGEVARDSYSLAVLMRDRCSGQRLLRKFKWGVCL